MTLSPILTMLVRMSHPVWLLLVLEPAEPQYPLSEIPECALSAAARAQIMDCLLYLWNGVGGRCGQSLRINGVDYVHIIDVIANVCYLAQSEPCLTVNHRQMSQFVSYSHVEVSHLELFGSLSHGGTILSSHDGRFYSGGPQAFCAPAVPHRETPEFFSTGGVVDAAIGQHSIAVGQNQLDVQRSLSLLALGQNC